MRKFWESIYCPNYISGYNPFILKGMNKAIERLALAVNNRQKIVVYGTYNVDGICAVSSLILVLRYLNADVEYLIYDRQEADARINSVDIKNNVDFLGAELLITLGVGLKSKEEIVEFSKYTNDKNLIHLEDKPIVQGLIILMDLSKLIKESNKITIKFINPIYSNEDIYIKKEHNAILGYVNNVLCFKCNFLNL